MDSVAAAGVAVLGHRHRRARDRDVSCQSSQLPESCLRVPHGPVSVGQPRAVHRAIRLRMTCATHTLTQTVDPISKVQSLPDQQARTPRDGVTSPCYRQATSFARQAFANTFHKLH